ncbi:(S)-benzoin forming benzil reductase [Lederbergia citrea]|uniref:(S)-benzoin forming benzil reductase n=1 Tax=Lederbergia citrea TaxID=2833581 RepID=A0A942Z2F1_9BACI|nr:(S)-benzoin forming benzil reductase [Lederbergia citrea]MBS4177353.1 (S)-benzoin forming benzil reductase [Lederbergia citrea]MBS4204016.1 (S)-benzoin forming benzil reductase [Lederbergia citrea]MBS4221399.1 (S)-benzoin forming benzil reductase [Lederbergia citrea]
MDVYFITGASKGIGLELSKQLIEENHFLVCTARTRNEELLQLAKERKCQLVFLQSDLSETEKIGGLMDEMIGLLPDQARSVTLINNAGVIDPIGRTEDNDPAMIAKSISVNLTAPMILSSTFINNLMNHKIVKKIINISSGAGRHPYSGWSSYCAGKAGLDHYTRVVAEEQKNVPYGVKVISIAPGIIDTGMQEKIRMSDEKDFVLLDRFKGYKEQGLLSSPEETARKLIHVIQNDHFTEMDDILDLRNF